MGLGSLAVAGLLAHAGFEWLGIETEHNAKDTAQIERMIAAIEPTEAVSIVPQRFQFGVPGSRERVAEAAMYPRVAGRFTEKKANR